jgi:hypothetical protein
MKDIIANDNSIYEAVIQASLDDNRGNSFHFVYPLDDDLSMHRRKHNNVIISISNVYGNAIIEKPNSFNGVDTYWVINNNIIGVTTTRYWAPSQKYVYDIHVYVSEIKKYCTKESGFGYYVDDIVLCNTK